jgi:hypothetical protein
MNPNRKAELKREYKETPTRRGIFRITNTTTGESWVEAARNLDTIKNRIWFNLGLGSHPNAKLQSAWNTAGADAIAFSIVEVFDNDLAGFALDDMMKERKRHWITTLGAESYS